ncbi:MAG: murein biosynthesis integral membrane protein MurJ [Candidatus Nealsonbacteria bacterium CG_4_9_14_3_um_filter_35_11]|nr:MAG: murein biosynthesis integral membrane protein MurJ [Candidatus Nealsonbacteria bacterium CG_4_9_14_3_um_filter_35_11]
MNFNRFFNFQSKTVGSAAGILAFAVLISHLLGLIRDRLLAGAFGAGAQLDIYFAAFRIPDLVYNILFAGSIIVAFLPLFSEYYTKNKQEGWEMANYVLNSFLFFFFLIILILFIFTPQLIELIVPGFSLESKAAAVALTRLMFLSPLFLGLSSLFSAILHYFNRFLVYSLAPILYNLGIIFGILVLAPRFGVFGVGWGVVLGAAFHLIVQIPSAKGCGLKYRPLFNLRNPAIWRLFKLVIPRTIAATASQINFIVITILASTIGAGAVAIFNLSNNLRYFPVGVLGVSFATAAFPLLSKNWTLGKKEEFFKNFSSIFRQILYLAIPVSLLVFLLKTQIVKIILETGRFSLEDVKLTAACLGIYSFSIFAQCLVPLILRGFFSLQDTKTPTLIALAFLVLNIILCFSFIHLLNFENPFSEFLRNTFSLEGIESFPVLGLSLAFSIGLLFEFLLLLIFFCKKVGDFGIKEIGSSFSKIIAGTLFMGLGVHLALKKTIFFLDTQTPGGIFLEFLIVFLLAIFIYFLITLFLKSPEIKALKSFIAKQFKNYGRKSN